MKRIINNPWFRGILITVVGGLLVGFTIHGCSEYQEQIEHQAIVTQLLREADGDLKINAIYDALKIYDELLRMVSEEKEPEIYSYIRNNQGICYHRLAEEKDKEVNLGKAILAYEETLRVRTIWQYPEEYAETQNNLGGAYWALSEVRDKEENLKKVVLAYEEALRVYTPEKYPYKYWYVKSNLEKVKKMLELLQG